MYIMQVDDSRQEKMKNILSIVNDALDNDVSPEVFFDNSAHVLLAKNPAGDIRAWGIAKFLGVREYLDTSNPYRPLSVSNKQSYMVITQNGTIFVGPLEFTKSDGIKLAKLTNVYPPSNGSEKNEIFNLAISCIDAKDKFLQEIVSPVDYKDSIDSLPYMSLCEDKNLAEVRTTLSDNGIGYIKYSSASETGIKPLFIEHSNDVRCRVLKDGVPMMISIPFNTFVDSVITAEARTYTKDSQLSRDELDEYSFNDESRVFDNLIPFPR